MKTKTKKTAVMSISKTANNGSTALLAKLTISAAITAAGSANTTIIIGSGLYNEKITIGVGDTCTVYCDGVVTLDGTGVDNC